VDPQSDRSPAHDPHVCQINTLTPGNDAATLLGYDNYNNVTDRYEYDNNVGPHFTGSCGAAPGGYLRHTVQAYRGDAQYLDPSVHLVSLPLTTKVYDGAGHQVAYTLFQYDEYPNRPLQDAPGITGHDAAYNTGSAARGNLTTIWRSKDGINLDTIGVQNTFDIAGNIVAQYDGNGNRTLFGYNDDGSNKYAFPTSISNALGQTTSIRYDYGAGKPASITDPNNALTTYAYNDALDRLTQVVQANGSRTNYSYPSPTQVEMHADQNTAGDQALHTKTLYDGLGRQTEQDTYESGSQYIAVKQSYDALGQVATTKNPSRPGDGLDFATTYTYDALGRVTKVQTADGAATSTDYNGNQTTITDAAVHKRVSTSDALGRVTKVVEDPNGLNYTTTYSYDALDNLVTVTQGGQTRTFSYDSNHN
jgi:YD repeat-containing protein